MTDEERWAEIEECFEAVRLDVENRCYADRSIVGARYLELLVRRHLRRIDELLLEDLIRDRD